ncbi:MAG: very short patch repair endonuclease [Patescibacteria group bacterium]
MTDRMAPDVRSRLMAKIRSKNTKIELLVFRALRQRKIYFQKHYRRAAGSPDVAWPKRKVAVFIDGCFWHGYRYPQWQHKLPSQFWRDKIERNRARDRRNFSALRRHGWLVLRIWEHQLHRQPAVCIERIISAVRSRDCLLVQTKTALQACATRTKRGKMKTE